MNREFFNLLPPAEVPPEQLRGVRERLDDIQAALEDTIQIADEAIEMIYDIQEELRAMTGEVR